MADPGYGFVPLSPDVHRPGEREQATHDRLVPNTFSGSLSVAFNTEQPLHIGSGAKVYRDDHIVRATMTVGDGWGVPGSTLKGVLRSRYEAMTRSCVLFKQELKGRVRSRSFPSLTHAQLDLGPQQTARLKPCDKKSGLCPACALFGSLQLRSRVRISDLAAPAETVPVVTTVPSLYGPRLHHIGRFSPPPEGARTVTVTRLHGRKFSRGRGPAAEARERIEVLPVGTSLAGRVQFKNVTSAEFGGLLLALGAKPPASPLKVGAAKGHCLGRIRLCDLQLSTRRGQVDPDPAACMAAFERSDEAWQTGIAALYQVIEEDYDR